MEKEIRVEKEKRKRCIIASTCSPPPLCRNGVQLPGDPPRDEKTGVNGTSARMRALALLRPSSILSRHQCG